MVKEIIKFLLENDPGAPEARDFDAPEDYKEVYGPEADPEYSLQQIKAAAPDFFNRKTTKHHGTRKVYKYRGNYVVLHNLRRIHTGWGHHSTHEAWPIYQWKRTEERPEGDLFFKAHANDLDDAKEMIKTGDFRTRRQRLGLPESEDENEDWKEVSDIPMDITKPTWFRDVPVGTAFKQRDGISAVKANQTDIDDKQKGRVNLGNPMYLCYPPEWGLSTIKSYSRRFERDQHLKKFWWVRHKKIGEGLDDDDEDLRELYGRNEIIRATEHFRLIQTEYDRFRIEAVKDVHPKVAHVPPSDVYYLTHTTDRSFNEAAIWEYGCGVYAGPDPDAPEQP